MSKAVLTAEAAQTILANNPRAADIAMAQAGRAMNAALRVYNDAGAQTSPQFVSVIDGVAYPHCSVPDVSAEFTTYLRQVKALSLVPQYLKACEAEAHFENRLAEANEYATSVWQANRDRIDRERLEQIRLGQANAWREQHGRALDTACRELIANVEAIRREVGTATTPEDLEIVTAHLVAELHSRSQSINTANRKKK